MRWLAIVEHEDVMIDDISAVIIEFSTDKKGPAPAAQPKEEPRSKNYKKHEESPPGPGPVKPGEKNAARNDPRRGSILSTGSGPGPLPFPGV